MKSLTTFSNGPLHVYLNLPNLKQGNVSGLKIEFWLDLFESINSFLRNRVWIVDPRKRRGVVYRSGDSIDATEKFDEQF